MSLRDKIKIGVEKGKIYCDSFDSGKSFFDRITNIDDISITLDHTKRIGWDCVWGCPSKEDFAELVKGICEQLENPEEQEQQEGKEWRDCWTYRVRSKKIDGDLPDVNVDVYLDKETGRPCFVLQGEDPAGAVQDLGTLIDLSKYIKMEITGLGQQMFESEVLANQIPFPTGGLSVCLTGNADDIIAMLKTTPEYQALITQLNTDAPLPAGAHYGISKSRISQYSGSPKQTVHCDVQDADVVVNSSQTLDIVVLGDDDTLTPNGGSQPVVKPLFGTEIIEGTKCVPCYKASGEIVDGDVVVTGTDPTAAEGLQQAVRVDFCLTCFLDAEGEGEKV